MFVRWGLVVWGLVGVLVLGKWILVEEEKTGELKSGVYVWNRVIGDAWESRVEKASGHFDELAFLSHEIHTKGGVPFRFERLDLDWRLLGQPEGARTFCIRVGALSSEALLDEAFVERISKLAEEIAEKCVEVGILDWELQLDYDCPTGRLGDYVKFVRALKEDYQGSLSITTLADWLGNREFDRLAGLCDRFVLQVHSLIEPSDGKDWRLFDRRLALDWAKAADGLDTPFWLALPNYGYRVLFDAHGNVVRVGGEGSDSWKMDGAKVLMADPGAVVGLMSDLRKARLRNLEGCVWFRLPMVGDALSWSWETLRMVSSGGEAEEAGVVFLCEQVEEELWEVSIANRSEDPKRLPLEFELTFSGDGTVTAWDVYRDYRGGESGGRLRFESLDLSETLGGNGLRKLAWVRGDFSELMLVEKGVK